MDQSDEQYVVPLQDQRVFGAGIKKQKVKFVRPEQEEPLLQDKPSGTSASERYLSIVGRRQESPNTTEAIPTPIVPSQQEQIDALDVSTSDTEMPIGKCQVCNLPVKQSSLESMRGTKGGSMTQHESSIAHQVCLEHSHPPSHLDRQRLGLKYLANYGYDPDERHGLGASRNGRLIPLKAVPKHDTAGLGHSQTRSQKRKDATTQTLDAGKIAKREDQKSQRGRLLQDLFYGSEDMNRYLHEDRPTSDW